MPLELVLRYMDKSLSSDGKIYHIGLLKFISMNPDKINKVIKNHIGYEYFDKALAQNYNVLEALCKSEEDVDRVIESFSCTGKYGESITNPNLIDFAIEILTKQNSRDDSKIKLFEEIKTITGLKSRNLTLQIDSGKLDIARKMFRNNKSINNIISSLNKS